MVEKWLIQVEEVMIGSLKKVAEEAVIGYANTPRERWVKEWPGQVSSHVAATWTHVVFTYFIVIVSYQYSVAILGYLGCQWHLLDNRCVQSHHGERWIEGE